MSSSPKATPKLVLVDYITQRNGVITIPLPDSIFYDAEDVERRNAVMARGIVTIPDNRVATTGDTLAHPRGKLVDSAIHTPSSSPKKSTRLD